MRKWNTIISLILIILFLIHAIAGSFQLMKIIPGGNSMMKTISCILMLFLIIHIVIGIKLTFDSIKIGKRSGKFYLRENAVFWTRRITGFAMILLIICHVILFMNKGEVFRLNNFNEIQLIFSILLVLTLVVHILSNIKPVLIGLGIAGFRAYVKDILLVFAIVLLISSVAFVVYFLRWNVLWRY